MLRKDFEQTKELYNMTDLFEFYTHPGPMTDPGEQAGLFNDLPADIPALCELVQSLLIHVFWAERYGRNLSDEAKQAPNVRPVNAKLALMRQASELPLTRPRPVDLRQVGNCRDYTTLLCAMLRHQGVPARARCGFARYFIPGHYEDHWVCEYWNANQARWVMVDAQLDPLQRQALNIPFDPCDVPADQFWPGGKAWQVCRAGQADPNDFGIADMHGLWFIRGDLLRDLAALNKIELLPWDGWGLADKEDASIEADDLRLLDRVAALTMAGNEQFAEMRVLYEEEARLRVPEVIRSYGAGGVREVRL
jgi:hypothetical protein